MIPGFEALCGLILWICFSKGTVTWVEIALLEFSIVLRSCVIAIKYGYLPNDEI